MVLRLIQRVVVVVLVVVVVPVLVMVVDAGAVVVAMVLTVNSYRDDTESNYRVNFVPSMCAWKKDLD